MDVLPAFQHSDDLLSPNVHASLPPNMPDAAEIWWKFRVEFNVQNVFRISTSTRTPPDLSMPGVEDWSRSSNLF
jgi:hypothetical protein